MRQQTLGTGCTFTLVGQGQQECDERGVHHSLTLHAACPGAGNGKRIGIRLGICHTTEQAIRGARGGKSDPYLLGVDGKGAMGGGVLGQAEKKGATRAY